MGSLVGENISDWMCVEQNISQGLQIYEHLQSFGDISVKKLSVLTTIQTHGIGILFILNECQFNPFLGFFLSQLPCQIDEFKRLTISNWNSQNIKTIDGTLSF